MTAVVSTTSNLKLGIYSWTSSSISINDTVNPFLQTYSTPIMTYSKDAPPKTFTCDFTFTLAQALNSLDPSQILTVEFEPACVLTGDYMLTISLSQGGQTLTSPNFAYTATSGGGTSAKSWYLAISNMFTVASPGVFYRLCVHGTLKK